MRIRGEFGRFAYTGLPDRYFVAAKKIPSDWKEKGGKQVFAWLNPRCWRLAPPLAGKRVAIVGNKRITDRGDEIDSHDHVIRINRMGDWHHDPVHDGVRVTIWAGLARPNIVPSAGDKARSAPYLPSCFPEIADGLSWIWSVSPFYLSARFLAFLRANGLEDRLVVSGSGPFFYDHFARTLPSDLFHSLFSIPEALHTGPSNRQIHYELLLTGVKIVILTVLAGADEISLFGFDNYEGSTRRPWSGHDLDYNQRVLQTLIENAESLSSRIKLIG
jgi:hypothetical protein